MWKGGQAEEAENLGPPGVCWTLHQEGRMHGEQLVDLRGLRSGSRASSAVLASRSRRRVRVYMTMSVRHLGEYTLDPDARSFQPISLRSLPRLRLGMLTSPFCLPILKPPDDLVVGCSCLCRKLWIGRSVSTEAEKRKVPDALREG